jgi:diguanylate cyclase (GGDEF)-like protein
MKTRIIFLDDEPQTAHRLQEILENHGFSVGSPKTLDEAFKEINSNRAELLIHSAHRTKTNSALCEEFFDQYPHFPSLHLATGPDAESYERNLKGPFHQKMRPLTPEKEFLKRVRRLIFLGRLSRQNSVLDRTVKLQNKIDQIFETLDLTELKEKSVHFFDEEFKAKNVYFLSIGGYGHYLQEMWKVAAVAPTDQNPTKHHLCSSKASTEAELSGILSRVSNHLPTGWELKNTRTTVENITFIPLVGNQSKKIFGHVMMVDPLLYGDQSLEKVLPYLTRVLGRHFEHTQSFANAKSLNYMDDLTELYNQRYLKLVLDKEISRSARTKTAFSVLFMDIDHFKQVNDTRGHLIGSKVLIEMSKILNQHIRVTDYGFRYGGDEFILILVGSDSTQSLAVAERIRKQVEASTFEIEDVKIRLTLSIGIATYPEHAMTKEEILELADRAMYCGKNKSRNVVYVAS